jgi:hypothetical protein
MNDEVGAILKGSYDLHVHAGPDPDQERRLDALETGRHAYEAEMGGFVLKSHRYGTASLAYVLNRMYPGLNVAGSIVLNTSVGGINPDAVDVAGRLGARVVWMPTMSARHYVERQGGSGGISLLDEGKLRPAVLEVLDAAGRYDMVVASGHVAPDEAIELFKQAKARGVNRLLATHPAGVASIDEQREMAALGAFLEYTFLACMPSRGSMSPAELTETVQTLGTEHCIVTTDLGQWMNPPPAEGMRMAIAALLDSGMSVDGVEALVKHNPARLLNVEE